MKDDFSNPKPEEELSEDHILTSIETLIGSDAFKLDDEIKIELIEKNFREIMEIMGLDLSDDSL